MPSRGLCAQVACVWEATARKPGNVHRYQDFKDLTYLDLLLSAAAIAPILESAHRQCIGATILEGIRATRRVVATNTNLGILLLLTPLAAVPDGEALREGAERLLADLDINDAREVYEAIRLASPGGMGRVHEQDVRDEPTLPLRSVMALAEERDMVARQYANGFQEGLEGVTALERGLNATGSLQGAISQCKLQ